MIALLAAMAHALIHRQMWVTPGYLLNESGAIMRIGATEPRRVERLGPLMTAAALPGTGFVYVTQDGRSVGTWTKREGIRQLGALPDNVEITGQWKIFAFANGEMLLQPDLEAAPPELSRAYAFGSDKVWRGVDPDEQLFGAVPLQRRWFRLFEPDPNHPSVIHFRQQSLDAEFEKHLGSADGTQMRSMLVKTKDLVAGFDPIQVVPTDSDANLAFASSTSVRLFSGTDWASLSVFDATGLTPESLVVAGSTSHKPALYGLDAKGRVRRRAANPSP